MDNKDPLRCAKVFLAGGFFRRRGHVNGTAKAMDDDDDPSPHDPLLDPDGIDPDDPEDDDPPAVGQTETFQAWEVIMAERDDAGQWQTVGEPVADARFDSMAVAHDYAERRNRMQFGRGFDWTLAPSKAWIAVRVGQRG